MRWSITKQLICPACGVVIADATYQRWPGNLTLLSPEGYRIQPESVGVQIRRAETEVERAPSAATRKYAEDRVRFLKRSVAELVFDLQCRNGHSTLRTMPQLVRAIGKAGGRWVDLG